MLLPASCNRQFKVFLYFFSVPYVNVMIINFLVISWFNFEASTPKCSAAHVTSKHPHDKAWFTRTPSIPPWSVADMMDRRQSGDSDSLQRRKSISSELRYSVFWHRFSQIRFWAVCVTVALLWDHITQASFCSPHTSVSFGPPAGHPLSWLPKYSISFNNPPLPLNWPDQWPRSLIDLMLNVYICYTAV